MQSEMLTLEQAKALACHVRSLEVEIDGDDGLPLWRVKTCAYGKIMNIACIRPLSRAAIDRCLKETNDD